MPPRADPAPGPEPFAGAGPLTGRGPHGRRPERLAAGVETMPGVGPRLAGSLRALGIATVGELLAYRPRRYEEPAASVRVVDLVPGVEATVRGEVVAIARRPARRRRLTIVEARVRDETGPLVAVWFNQPWVADRLPPGTRVALRGSLDRGGFVVRDYDTGEGEELERVAPVYPGSEALPSRRLRELVGRALELALPHLPDPLPAALRARLSLPLRADAVAVLHRPETVEEAEEGRRRLAFEELLALQVGLLRRRGAREDAEAPALGEPGELIAAYRRALPFRLTPAQERVIAEVDGDLARPVPMERLLQGDVGAGKTVVALYALLRAVERGHQGALMAPTETLAEQHFLTIEGICTRLDVPCELLTSSLAKRRHDAVRGRLASGEAALAVGTHALIQEAVAFRSLAVAVVDEQHRFGVEQRGALGEGLVPHRLHMTATPIPRTLALTVFGDLAVSEIDRPPAGRQPVVTRWIAHDRAAEAYTRLRRLLDEGRQAYVVCPLVSPSETVEAKAAEAEAERLRAAELRSYRVGCLHGRLRTPERRAVMQAFARGELDVLVATTVIEVGVDVANATIMIVQEADRFGLAQLHQLRGRVGRGSEQSYCLLVSRPREELTDAACERLEAMVRTTDGFELAEVDLELRGEGQLLGTRQSGLSDLAFTRLSEDRDLLERARDEAPELVPAEGPLDEEVARLFGESGATAGLA